MSRDIFDDAVGVFAALLFVLVAVQANRLLLPHLDRRRSLHVQHGVWYVDARLLFYFLAIISAISYCAVALATAIDPTRWLVYLVVVGAGLAGFELLPLLSSGRPLSLSAEIGSLLSVMLPAFVGAAMVRLAWRQAI